MAEPKKRGLFGLPSLVVIGIGVAFLLIFILAILVGPIGQGLMTSLFGEAIEFPDWMVVPQPVPHLPAPEIFNLFGWSITNSMIGAWLTVVFLVVISFVVTRRMKLVPGRLQGLFEALLGWMYDFVVGISGDANARRFFPVICTIFLFVLFNAWLSLLPGFVSVEYKRYEPIPENATVVVDEEHGGEYTLVYNEAHALIDEEHGAPEIALKDGEFYLLETEEFIRGANTDINTPLAIAVISVFYTLFMGVKSLGAGWFKQYFNFGPLLRAVGGMFRGKFNLMNLFTGMIDAFVGLLEWLGFWIRLISFTFRLFGNMTAGEILILIIAFLVPWVVSPIFYGLELLIGFVQALVFAGLTAVFVTMAVTPHGGEAH